ncbi:NAD(P)/FAD-dependent oxidoreductase [Pseudothioclava arenosa]|uniref:Pyridine nucleotide-disulfide oxidoreductase n=1 Tax=Pseudothioclava arenosa TaxID=1795308 RepID=A0A2A4CPH2_9RHOB|nr:FAD/NAD(P)-binding oxidoreductase [Pseudothioclava arenosa]PCD76515.1 pyridine nucleotide-disulfide oxidoreductase [Pseudothioclava arenosa]
MSGIVIVGAGQAAASMAAKLRAKGYDGEITIFGDEPVAPYQRPPLSKAYLLGEMPLERLTLRGADWYAENKVTLRLNERVTAIDPEARTLQTTTGTMGYDELALCTGATPRRLPAAIGGDLPGVFTVRNLADVEAMKPEFRPGRRLLVIGGGYIGLEAAAVARKLGLEVTLIEAAPRILGRVACAETADAIRTLHSGHGVTIIEGKGIAELYGSDTFESTLLDDKSKVYADFCIVGIGVTPNTELAESAGITCANGIVTDAQGKCSTPHVWAAGDCAEIDLAGTRTRLESVGNAIDMGELIAENMLGAGRSYQPKPWFWSDQYDAKLQIAGWNAGYDRVIARQTEGQSFWYYKGDQLIAVDALNAPRAYMIGKRLIEAGKSPDPALLADPGTDLKGLLA